MGGRAGEKREEERKGAKEKGRRGETVVKLLGEVRCKDGRCDDTKADAMRGKGRTEHDGNVLARWGVAHPDQPLGKPLVSVAAVVSRASHNGMAMMMCVLVRVCNDTRVWR